MVEVKISTESKFVIFLLIIGAVFFIALVSSIPQSIESCKSCYIMGFGAYSDVILILLIITFLMFVLLKFYSQFYPV